jgi:cation transport ATPase
MTQTYQLTGMTCSSCEAKVKSALLKVADVTNAAVSKKENNVTITMNKQIALFDFKKVLDTKYQIAEINKTELVEQTKTWFKTYQPILLIFFFISLVCTLVQLQNQHFNVMHWMQHFMAGFFLVFSFFKLLNIKGFAESYAMYDVVAKPFPVWGYVYPFIELVLGIAYLINFNSLITNTVTLVIMSIGIIGVLKSVLNKSKIKCACLGAIFNLPMSTVTIIEDALMIGMSGLMLINLI